MRCEVENNWLQSFNERFHTKKQSRKPIQRMFQMISWLICIFNIITHTRESQTGFYLSFSTGCVWALCFCNKILHSADATVKWDHPLTRGAAGWHILVGSRGRWWASSLLLHDRAGSVKRLWWDRGCCLAATLRRLLMRLQRRSLQTGSFFRMLIYLSSSPFFWLQVFGVQVQKKNVETKHHPFPTTKSGSIPTWYKLVRCPESLQLEPKYSRFLFNWSGNRSMRVILWGLLRTHPWSQCSCLKTFGAKGSLTQKSRKSWMEMAQKPELIWREKARVWPLMPLNPPVSPSHQWSAGTLIVIFVGHFRAVKISLFLQNWSLCGW